MQASTHQNTHKGNQIDWFVNGAFNGTEAVSCLAVIIYYTNLCCWRSP